MSIDYNVSIETFCQKKSLNECFNRNMRFHTCFEHSFKKETPVNYKFTGV